MEKHLENWKRNKIAAGPRVQSDEDGKQRENEGVR